MSGELRPSALNTLVVRVVWPPSTSLVPAAAPAAALPVSDHLTPAPAVWSSSGWLTSLPTNAATGFARSHTPVGALSCGPPTVQPGLVSMSCVNAVVTGPARNEITPRVGAAVGNANSPPRLSPAV